MSVKSVETRTDAQAGGLTTKRSQRNKHWRLRRILTTVAVVCSAVVLSGVGYELALPTVGDARARVAEIVRSHHGQIDRLPLPTKLASAVVAVEDKYFYSNVFVNVFYGVARAAFAAVSQSGDPGGSTIEQQLAKQLYPQGTGLAGPLEDLGLGIKLSLVYSKAQILNMYLNVVSYGNGYWGDIAAARGYFGVAPDQLSWAEATLLAGLPQAPSLYDPFRHLRLATRRQGLVVDQLADNGYLTRAQAAAIDQQRLRLKKNGTALTYERARGARKGLQQPI